MMLKMLRLSQNKNKYLMNLQMKFKSYLGEEKRKQQKNDYDDCSLMMPEAKAKAKATKGTGL